MCFELCFLNREAGLAAHPQLYNLRGWLLLPQPAATTLSSPSSNFPPKAAWPSSPSETEYKLNQHNLTILAADVISVRDAGSGFCFGTYIHRKLIS